MLISKKNIKSIYIFCLCITFYIASNAQGLDYKWTYNANNNASVGKTNFYNHYANTVIFTSVGVPISLWLNPKTKKEAIVATAAWLINNGNTVVLKKVANRARPFAAHPQIINRYNKAVSANYSFPSGHASMSFVAATSLALAYPKWYVILPAYSYAFVMSYARVYQGVHYPSDVLAGALLGTGSVYVSKQLYKIFYKKRHKATVKSIVVKI